MTIQTIGILGAGQLGRMLALSGYPLGYRFRFFDSAPDAPAGHVGEQVVGSFEDLEALQAFAKSVDLITYEFENVPSKALAYCAQYVPVSPNNKALEVAQDRVSEKTLCQTLGIPTHRFFAIQSLEDLTKACQELGFPAVLKTRRLGYDGKGQRVIRNEAEIKTAYQELCSQALILEEFVRFDREISIVAVRGRGAETKCYPLVENLHRNGILWRSVAPAPNQEKLAVLAEEYAQKVASHLDYCGVFALEFFVQNGKLLFNEMAPRVHNSGHWTIEGAHTSQFENHIRAVTGSSLGSTSTRGYSVMYNILSKSPHAEPILALQNVHLHLYAKSDRPGRKLGHITACAESSVQLTEMQSKLEALLVDSN